MRISYAVSALAAGTAAHGIGNPSAVRRGSDPCDEDYDPLTQFPSICVSAALTLYTSAPSPPPELTKYSHSYWAASRSVMTDMCQMYSSIPTSLSSVVSEYDKSLASWGMWFTSERDKIPTTICPTPFPGLFTAVECASGEKRPITSCSFSNSTTRGPGPVTTGPTNGGSGATPSSGAGSPAAPTTAQPAGVAGNAVLAAGMGVVAFVGAVIAI